jgi:hypothetical protein
MRDQSLELDIIYICSLSSLRILSSSQHSSDFCPRFTLQENFSSGIANNISVFSSYFFMPRSNCVFFYSFSYISIFKMVGSFVLLDLVMVLNIDHFFMIVLLKILSVVCHFCRCCRHK